MKLWLLFVAELGLCVLFPLDYRLVYIANMLIYQTFGISILEYVCRRMARQETSGNEGKHEFKTKRIRCVWTIREYGK